MTTSHIPNNVSAEQLHVARERARRSDDAVAFLAGDMELTQEQVREALEWDFEQKLENIFSVVKCTQQHIISSWNSVQDNPSEELLQSCTNAMSSLLSEVKLRTKQMCLSIRHREAALFTSDVFGVMQHLFAYNFATYIDVEGNLLPRNQQEDRFRKVLKFVAEDEAFKSAQTIANWNYTPEQFKDYAEFRFDHWTETANVLSTYISDLRHGSSRETHTNNDRYRAYMREASIWLNMFHENSEWSIWGIYSVMQVAYQYKAMGGPATIEQGREMGKWLFDLKDAGGEIRKGIAAQREA